MQLPIEQAISGLAQEAHDCAVEKGWYNQPRTPPELLCLIHSELSESLEAFRECNPPDKHCPDYSSAEVELADAVIRIMDMSVVMEFDLAGAILAKMRFNWKRPTRHGGKAY